MPRISATFCISLPPEMARQIEAACRSEHRTRSELVREALRAYLRSARPGSYPLRMPEIQPASLAQPGRTRGKRA